MPAEAAEEALPAVPAADAPDKEAQPDKNAAEEREIVIAQQRECQRQRIQAEAALAQQADHAGQHQRQESQRIEPDDVPIVARHKGAQGVHHGKRHERRLVPGGTSSAGRQRRTDRPARSSSERAARRIPAAATPGPARTKDRGDWRDSRHTAAGSRCPCLPRAGTAASRRSGAFPGTRRRRGNTDATCRAPAPAGHRTATGRRARSTAASRRMARRTTGRDSGASAACGQFSAWEGLLCAMRRRSWGMVASKLTP